MHICVYLYSDSNSLAMTCLEYIKVHNNAYKDIMSSAEGMSKQVIVDRFLSICKACDIQSIMPRLFDLIRPYCDDDDALIACIILSYANSPQLRYNKYILFVCIC